MDYARMLLPAAIRKKDDSFTIDLAITDANLQFGVTPYWNAGGYCNIDWGDGSTQAATTSGTQLTHTYAAAGSYRVKVRGDMYRFRVGSTNPAAVIDCNGNWEALGTLTNGYGMFNGCLNAALGFNNISDTIQVIAAMFYDCRAARLVIDRLPPIVTNVLIRAFGETRKSTILLDNIATNAPAQGWTEIQNMGEMFFDAGHDNSPGTCTGSVANFMRCFPNVNACGNAFYGTNTTTFGTSDYFEIVLTTTEANQSWGFTATSSAGRWYCFDWGDGAAVTSNKNLDVFTSGTKVSHTFATPGTYHIKLATAPCTIVFDPYDSDNGNWAALGLPAEGLGGVFVKEGTTTVSSAMTMSGAMITSGQSQVVYNHGSALYTTIESGGYQNISSGGGASSTVINEGGSANVYATIADVVAHGKCTLFSGGLLSGGIAINAADTAIFTISSGGTGANITISSGGRVYVYSAGILSGGTFCPGQRWCYILNGGTGYDITMNPGAQLLCLSAGAYVSGFLYNSGNTATVISSGTIVENVSIGGLLRVNDLGLISGATVLSGGSLTISSGGTALAVTSNAGATVTVLDGGYIEYA